MLQGVFFDLAVFGFVIEGEPEDLYIDEGDLDGLAIFDLTVNETVILEGLDPSIHQITYYQTLSDSNNGVNSILTPQAYQNTANPQTIYVRVVNTESNGYALTSFQIETDGFLKVENQAFNDLAMYPNPTSEGVTISSSKLINETIVELFDISGKRLLSKKSYRMKERSTWMLAHWKKGFTLFRFPLKEIRSQKK